MIVPVSCMGSQCGAGDLPGHYSVVVDIQGIGVCVDMDQIVQLHRVW